MTPRPDLRQHVHPGQRVFNVHDQRVYRVHSLYDGDRSALIVGRGVRFIVSYGVLFRDFRTVQPF